MLLTINYGGSLTNTFLVGWQTQDGVLRYGMASPEYAELINCPFEFDWSSARCPVDLVEMWCSDVNVNAQQ